MSSSISAALRLELRPSRQRRRWRWLTHFLVLVSLPMLSSISLVVLVAALVASSWYRTRIDQHITLLWHSDGLWSVFEAGREQAATLAGIPFVQPWLVILPLSLIEQRRTRYLAIFPDMLSTQMFRRLRVRLRSQAPNRVDQADSELR